MSTFALCLILSLSICYNHHLAPGWPGSGLFGWPYTLQLACQPKHLWAVRASAMKQNLLMNLCGSNLTITPCYPLTRQMAARRAHTGCTCTRLQWQQAERAGSSACKISWTETSFCNTKEQHAPEQKKHLLAAVWHADRAKEQQLPVFTLISEVCIFNYKEITKILIETHTFKK